MGQSHAFRLEIIEGCGVETTLSALEWTSAAVSDFFGLSRKGRSKQYE